MGLGCLEKLQRDWNYYDFRIDRELRKRDTVVRYLLMNGECDVDEDNVDEELKHEQL